MEHRCAGRMVVDAECILRSAVAGTGLVVIRDVSLGGVFVGRLSVRLPLMAMVHLDLVPLDLIPLDLVSHDLVPLDVPQRDLASARDRQSGPTALSVPAMVVRVQRDGVALMFDRPRPGVLSRVLSLGKPGSLPRDT
jgi:hypothetical protein